MRKKDVRGKNCEIEKGWFGITISDRTNYVLGVAWWVIFLFLILLGWFLPQLLEARR